MPQFLLTVQVTRPDDFCDSGYDRNRKFHSDRPTETENTRTRKTANRPSFRCRVVLQGTVWPQLSKNRPINTFRTCFLRTTPRSAKEYLLRFEHVVQAWRCRSDRSTVNSDNWLRTCQNDRRMWIHYCPARSRKLVGCPRCVVLWRQCNVVTFR